MQIYEFRLNFTEVCLQGSNWQYIPALVQINGLAPASNKPLSFCKLCLDQSVQLRNRTVPSLDMWILHWRRSHWCLKSLVTQLGCLFNRWPIGDRWVPLKKNSNAASVGPMLVQRWHRPLAQRCANVSPTLVWQRWADVGTTLGQRWHATVGPTLGQLTNPCWPNVGEPTLAQRKGWHWANVAMLSGKLRKPTSCRSRWFCKSRCVFCSCAFSPTMVSNKILIHTA